MFTDLILGLAVPLQISGSFSREYYLETTENAHFQLSVIDSTLLFCFFKTGFLCSFGVCFDLELALYARLALRSQRSARLCLLSAGIKGVCTTTAQLIPLFNL